MIDDVVCGGKLDAISIKLTILMDSFYVIFLVFVEKKPLKIESYF